MTTVEELDGFGATIEEKIRDLLLQHVGLDEVKVIWRGDPFRVPTRLHPFGIVALLSEEDPAGERGYDNETGPVVYLKYSGFVQFEVLQRDSDVASDMDETRRADVPSYRTTRRLVRAARTAILGWAGPDGGIPDANRLVSEDGKETTLLLQVGRVENGLGIQTRSDNVTNVGTFPFSVITRREEF